MYAIHAGYLNTAVTRIYCYHTHMYCDTGRWDVLNVAAGYASSVNYSDNDVMTAVGFLEGALTQQSVLDTHLQLFSN